MDASRTLARQAANALDEFAANGDAPSVADIAARLGVSDRHLRRIFFAEHGVTPLQYLQTRRLLLAKQLLTDTRMPVAQIALSSGFRSLRRFNAAFVDGYRMNPTRLRRAAPRAGARATSTGAPADAAASEGSAAAITVTLGYRPPLDSAACSPSSPSAPSPASRARTPTACGARVRAGIAGAERRLARSALRAGAGPRAALVRAVRSGRRAAR